MFYKFKNKFKPLGFLFSYKLQQFIVIIIIDQLIKDNSDDLLQYTGIHEEGIISILLSYGVAHFLVNIIMFSFRFIL